MVYRPSEGRNQKKQTPPEQPNLVPLMNLFITIIPFLLTIVVISQVALIAMNFSKPGSETSGTGGSGSGPGAAQEIKLIIMASSDGMEMYPGFKIRGWGNEIPIRNTDIGVGFQGYNYIELNRILGDIKKSINLNEISVIVYPDVLYGTLVQTIDLCKSNGFPNVIYKPAGVLYGSGG